MNNKTCGECSWFSESGNRCKLHNNQYIFSDKSACKDFAQIQKQTNHDQLAEDKEYTAAVIIAAHGRICPFCAYYVNKKCTASGDKNCFHGVVEWLNTPAESEGEG